MHKTRSKCIFTIYEGREGSFYYYMQHSTASLGGLVALPRPPEHLNGIKCSYITRPRVKAAINMTSEIDDWLHTHTLMLIAK